MNTCYFKHSFLPSFKFRDKQSSINNLESTTQPDDTNPSHNTTDAEKSGYTITPDMYNKVMTVLNQKEEFGFVTNSGTGQVHHMLITMLTTHKVSLSLHLTG